jgi:predicted aspartyl protease
MRNRLNVGRADRGQASGGIEKRVKVCGTKRCVNAVGVVDTGATVTAITRSLADRIGAKKVGQKRRLNTVGGTVEVQPVMIRVCLSGSCGCATGFAASVKTDGFGGKSSVLIGQDYLSHARAQIDAATGKIRCRMRKARRRR